MEKREKKLFFWEHGRGEQLDRPRSFDDIVTHKGNCYLLLSTKDTFSKRTLKS